MPPLMRRDNYWAWPFFGAALMLAWLNGPDPSLGEPLTLASFGCAVIFTTLVIRGRRA